jgi:hypothetical protein
MSLPDKFANVRHWGQCLKCHRFRELRAAWNDSMSEVTSVCDACFNVPMDEEGMELIFDKADVPIASRTVKRHVENARKQYAELTFNLEKIFPEDG